MDYNDIESFYDDISIRCIESLESTAKAIRQGWEDIIENEIYNSYFPRVYERQKELLHSIIIEPVQSPADGEFYIDIRPKDELHGYNDTWNDDIEENTTFDEILTRFADTGFYARSPIDTSELTQEEFIENQKACKLIATYLRQWFDFDI